MSNFGIKIDYEKSHGSYAYDKNSGRFILDFLNHFSSLPLGYNAPALKSESFIDEMSRVNYVKTSMCEYDSDERNEFLKEFSRFVPDGFHFTHFSCTGALAIEAAIKSALAYHNYKRTRIISITDSFHGVNSFGNFTTTSPRLNGIPQHPQFTIDTIDNILKWYSDEYFDGVCAIIIEPIQCTSGDICLDIEKLRRIREVCTKHGIVLIYDEIQTGLSSGKSFYYQHYDVEPDIIVFGKKFQVSGIIVKNGFDSIRGDYWRLCVTWDGDLIDMIRSKYILREIQDKNLLQNSILTGAVLKNELRKIDLLKDVRGIGSLIAFDFETKEKRDSFYKKAFELGLIANPTSEKSIRLRPNLAVTMDEINNAIQIIKRSV